MTSDGSGHDPYAALRHPAFRRFLTASVVGTIAAEMQVVAVGWELFERTNSRLALGLVGLVQAIPIIGLALPAGQVADRVPRKLMVMATHAIMALASLGLAYVSIARAPIGLMYAALGLTGVALAFAFPARWAMMPELVPREAFVNAVTWRTSGWQVAAVAGPALGGLAYWALREPAPIYLIDAAGNLAALAVVAPIPSRGRPRGVEPMTGRSFLAGLKFVWGEDLILATITLDMFAVLLGGAVTLLPVFARDVLHVGPLGLGLLRAAPSFGAASMALALAHRPPMRRAGPTLLAAVVGFGLATIGFGLSRSPALSFALLFLTGALDNVSVVVRQTLVQLRTPDALRGRVSAVNSVFISVSNELGGFESGAAAELIGTVPAVVAGGVGCILVVLGVAWWWPGVRKLGRLEAAGRAETVFIAEDAEKTNREWREIRPGSEAEGQTAG